MVANALLFFLSIVVFAAFLPFEAPDGAHEGHETIAENFMLYRSAATTYAVDNPAFIGEVSSMRLPSGFASLRAWRNYIDASGIYTYGPLDPGVLDALGQRLDNSMLIGKSQGGNLVSPRHGVLAPLPAWMPDDRLVSIVRR